MTAAWAGGDPEVLVAVAASATAGAALVLPDRRRRALAMVAAAVLAGVGLAVLVGADPLGVLSNSPAIAAAAVAGAALVVALAVLVTRRPAVLPLLLVAAFPFRVPVPTGDETANLLVPLYGVVAAGCLAYAFAALRGRDTPAGELGARRLRIALAVVLVLYGIQALYTTDPEQATQNVAFFYVPFALLFLLVLEAPWTRRVLVGAFGIVVGLAALFAAVGIAQFLTGRLLLTNAKLLEANELKPYFRVNSLFYDPNMYGRFLALAIIAIAAALLWSRRTRPAVACAAALAALWAGLVVSLSQSSFAAVLIGLAVVAASRWRPSRIVAVSVAAVVAGAVVVAAAPAAIGLDTGSERGLNRATSGRVELVEGGLRMVRDRPLTGFGSGSFAERYRAREGVRNEDDAAISHTTPLTVAAEQGAVGLAAYLFLLVAALATAFSGLLAPRLREADIGTLARLTVAAGFCGVVVHTLVYSAFLEDPATWLLLGLAAALAGAAAVRPSAGDA